MLAERTHGILPHFEVHEKKFGLCWQQYIVLYSLSLQVTYVQTVFRSKHWQSWSETMCSKCSHPCRTTRYNDGNTKLRHILTTTNTPPPSRSGMQRKSNRVATITSQSTTDDLQQKTEKTREINVLRGLPANVPINISMDVRYNSTSLKKLRLWTECKSSSGNHD